MFENILIIAASFALLVAGGELLVRGAVGLAERLQMSAFVIGAVIIGFGSSMPELVTSIEAGLRGVPGIAIGNIVGSNIFNMLAVIGVAAAIQPAALPPSVLSLHLFVMVAFTLVLFAMTYEYDGRGVITRYEGFALVAAFLAYDTYVVLQHVRIGS